MAISLAYVHIKPYCRRSITYLTKVCVKSGYIYHTAHALFFTRPADMETVSHPVTANQNGRVLQTSPFRIAAYLCTGNHPRCSSTPIFTQDSSSSKEKKWCKAKQLRQHPYHYLLKSLGRGIKTLLLLLHGGYYLLLHGCMAA